jgi:hypothetical protein
MTIVISEDVSLLYIKVRRTNIADSEWYYCGIPVPGGNWEKLSEHVAMTALRERWIGDPSLGTQSKRPPAGNFESRQAWSYASTVSRNR